MAATGVSFAISLGVNAFIGLLCLILFGFFRLRRYMRKFYMPRSYLDSTRKAAKPTTLAHTFFAWIGPTWATSEENLIRVGGYDAAMYIKILTFGVELFIWTSIWVLIVVLPTNLVGKEVNRLLASGSVPTSPYTYWISPPPPPTENGPPSPQQPQTIKTPSFYTPTPPAPAGITWWAYAAGVPPLPDPASVLGANYSNYDWRYDSNFQSQSYTFSSLDKLTMSNIGQNSGLLWVHVIAVWGVCLIVFRLLWKYSKDAVELHLQYLSTVEKGAETHSVIVTDIPGTEAGTVTRFVPQKVRQGVSAGATKSRVPGVVNSSTHKLLPSSVGARRTSRVGSSILDTEDDVERGVAGNEGKRMESGTNAWETASRRLSEGLTVEQMVRREYDELFEDDVAAVHTVYNTSSLDPLVKEYEGMLRNLTDLIDDYTSQKSRGKDVKRKETRVLGLNYDKWGKENYPGKLPHKVDQMQWYVKRLTELRRLILEDQEKCLDKPSATSFVTFKSRRSQTIASNSLQHPDVKAWHPQSAPAPSDVVWTNVLHRAWERQSRFVIIWVLFILLSLFYTIPVGAVQALIEVQRLNSIPGFKSLDSITFINALIQAILPGLVLNIFLAVLPMLLSFMNKQQGMFSFTAIDFGVIRKYFIFLIITVFFGSFIGGALFNQFNQWIDNPSSAVTILGTAAPLTSIFFLTYIELQALTSIPLSFLRLLGLVLFWLKSRLASTPRARARLWGQQRFKFGPELPRHILIMFVGIVFSVINPLVPVMTIIYFCMAVLTEKYNMLYVYYPLFDSGGKMWAECYGQIMSGVLVFQLVMIALLAIKKSYSAILIAPLLCVTIIFWRACKPVFALPMSVLSLRTAVDQDHNDKISAEEVPLDDAKKENTAEETAEQVTYLMPAMNFKQQRHEDVLREAADMDLVLQGKKELPKADDEAVEAEAEPLPAPGAVTDKSDYGSRGGRKLLGRGDEDSAARRHIAEGEPSEITMVPLAAPALCEQEAAKKGLISVERSHKDSQNGS